MRRGYELYKSPLLVGAIGIVVTQQGVEQVFLQEEAFDQYRKVHKEVRHDPVLCAETVKQLDEYFQGERKIFTLPIVTEGTVFREKVWAALRQIPYAKTRSYKELAQMIQSPKAVRAVGGANRANPLPIIIPCHRVVGSNGKLIGFMGEHTDIQAMLLRHERTYEGDR